jgi:HEAT repeat protein
MPKAEYFREWLQKFPKEPAEQMTVAFAAVDAFEACKGKHSVTQLDLEPLVTAASSPHKLVFETGAHLLAQLAIRCTAAQQCVLTMARDKNSTARFHAVAYLIEEMPEEFRLEIIKLALSDRSAKVRAKGIERAEQFKFKQLLSQLEEMQQTDSNDKVQRSLALHVPLLRDGYHLEKTPDGYYLTVRRPKALGGPFIPNKKYSEEFVRQEVARLQSEQR